MQLDTLKNAIGIWRHVKTLAWLSFMTSGAVYGFMNDTVGYLMLLASSALIIILTGREFVIDGMRRINTVTELRSRMLDYGDHEYVLKQIQSDQLWRGEEVDPQVTKRLAQIEAERELFQARVLEIASELLGQTKAENGGVN